MEEGTLISEGAYGRVYKVQDQYAVKVETAKGQKKRRLRDEANILTHIQGHGIPKLLCRST